ncbi:MAG: molybdopterin molybdotransferase MoeA [Burkholderiales bacterium]|nr:molybdopterin molybdotransferase MoeA [Burkholderiales bacterium]MCA3162504.1 molybdopterin molybdotransferase MoeA [Burkholderiales bacterium]MCA3164013.1 molybdopterin molybdotransferase MoeA [Burkholderiales bacterium]MCA3166413.1 molybdopterin molybdotransferase MoeA [Burkholderiales bacterium]MCA3170841.1 molybdopterin molybdotransferase MoeA [Burkholderiales bacterium]
MKPLLSVDAALSALLNAAQPVSATENVPTLAANHRVLAHDLVSPMNVPQQPTSAMDGYAVRAADLQRLPARLRVTQRIAAGQVGSALAAGCCARIFTGAPLPSGADTVVMQEAVQPDAEHAIFSATVSAGHHVRPVGEDIHVGQTLLQAGQRLSPQALALAATVGLAQLQVFRRIRVGLFFTGDELVMPGQDLQAGNIYNSNRFALRALLERLDCQINDYGQVPDDLEATVDTLQQAKQGNDVVLTCGGVSVGEEDHVKNAVQRVGQLHLWQIAVKPGKPLAFGTLGMATKPCFFLGLPGNPVSAWVTFLLFARPFLQKLQGVQTLAPVRYRLAAHFDWLKPDQRQEYLRAHLDETGRVVLSGKQGSAVMTSVVRAQGLVEVPPATVIRSGDAVYFLPFSELV